MRVGYRSIVFALIATASAIPAGRGLAADGLAAVGGTAELEARIAALEAQLAEQADERDRVAADAVSYHGGTGATACDDDCRAPRSWIGRDFFNDCCRGCGFYGGGEIMFLKPFASEFGGVFLDAASADEYLPGWRLWGGYQNADGLGWRVGWWQWDQTSTGRSNIFGSDVITTLGLTFQKLDLEATQMLSFRRWDLLLGAGVTYVGNNYDTLLRDPEDPANFTSILSRFDGWGLTSGLLAIRDLPGVPGLKLASSVRWSGVYGTNLISEFGDDRLPIESAMVNILELKIGPQYERSIGGGTTFFTGVGFEAQYWAGLGGLAFFEGIGGDIGLVGFTVNTGFRR
jgi:hypothetical protein